MNNQIRQSGNYKEVYYTWIEKPRALRPAGVKRRLVSKLQKEKPHHRERI